MSPDALRAAGLVLCAALLAACAGTPGTDALTASRPDGLPPRAELTETPFFPQTRYYCGPAAMAAALNDTGLETTPAALGEQLFTPGRKGTLASSVVAGARRNGRLAVPVDGMAEALSAVAAGKPVLVLQNLGLEMAPQWHYALLVGYDLPAERAILRSGTTRRQVMDLGTFEHTWRRSEHWAVIVADPAGPVPGAASRAEWMAEAAGLERAGQGAAAETAYRTATRGWPDDPVPWIALANRRYGADDLAGAEAALRRAVAAAPDHAAALNNLAHVLMRRGRLAEAETMAERAVAAGGDHAAAAERTLTEIRGARGS